MRIVVNHLTRMAAGYVCVAGLDLETRAHVRPVMPVGRMETWMLAAHGGPFEVAAVIDLGDATPCGAPPMVEDCRFDWLRAAWVKDVDPDRFWRMLQIVARPRFADLFGDCLHPRETGGCWAAPGEGAVSLGCITPFPAPNLFLDRGAGEPRIRMEISEGALCLTLPVTDIRLFNEDHVTPNERRVSEIDGRLRSGEASIIGVGLTRPYAPTSGERPLHWLQVNNIHLASSPAWKLGDFHRAAQPSGRPGVGA